jgi:ABC-2 type transport system permease protein
MNAIRESSLGGTPWPDLALCLLLGVVYVGIGVAVLERVLGAARKRAALSLT